MKELTPSRLRLFLAVFTTLLALGVSSCSNNPQRLLFSNHPTEYKKVEQPAVATVPAADTAPELTASVTAEPALLPANAYAQEEAKAALASQIAAIKKATPQAETRKISRKEKIALVKTAMQEVKTAKKEIKQLTKAEKKDIKAQAEGPVSNSTAVKIIILGLILALLGLVVPFLYLLGSLVLVIGLILLLLNYL